MGKEIDVLEAHRTYTDGKMRRYNLLFSVNGGAFAIAKLIREGNTGGLDLERLALGMMLFSAVMAVDIWFFGQMMRNELFGGRLVFGPGGEGRSRRLDLTSDP